MRKSSFIVLGSASISKNFYLPLINTPVRTGFPSPADDYIESKLDLSEHLVQHPNATYYIRAIGDSMVDYGIYSGDLLIVDRSLDAKSGDIIIIAIDGELTCKKLSYIKVSLSLFLVIVSTPRFLCWVKKHTCGEWLFIIYTRYMESVHDWTD